MRIILNEAAHNLFQSPNTGLREMFLHCKATFRNPKLYCCISPLLSQLYEMWMWSVGSKQLVKLTDVLGRISMRACPSSMKTLNGRSVSPQGPFPDWFWWDKGQATSNRMSFSQTHHPFFYTKCTKEGIDITAPLDCHCGKSVSFCFK